MLHDGLEELVFILSIKRRLRRKTKILRWDQHVKVSQVDVTSLSCCTHRYVTEVTLTTQIQSKHLILCTLALCVLLQHSLFCVFFIFSKKQQLLLNCCLETGNHKMYSSCMCLSSSLVGRGNFLVVSYHKDTRCPQFIVGCTWVSVSVVINIQFH